MFREFFSPALGWNRSADSRSGTPAPGTVSELSSGSRRGRRASLSPVALCPGATRAEPPLPSQAAFEAALAAPQKLKLGEAVGEKFMAAGWGFFFFSFTGMPSKR